MCKNNVGYCLNENRILFKQDAVSVFSRYASVFCSVTRQAAIHLYAFFPDNPTTLPAHYT